MAEPGGRGDRILLGRTVAAIAAIGRTGAANFGLEYYDIVVRQLNPDSEQEHPQPFKRTTVEWVARAEYREAKPTGGPEAEHVMTRIESHAHPYGAMAVEELLAELINGGTCARCGRTTVWQLTTLGADKPSEDYCNMILTTDDLDDPEAYEYRRSCEAGA